MNVQLQSASYYERAGKEAVAYVKRALTLGSTNNMSDFIRSPMGGGTRWVASAGAQALAGQRINASLKAAGPMPRNDPRFGITLVETWSKEALTARAGNCALQAAVAFTYLRDKRIFPIDYMKLGGQADHGFVIMGRDGKSDLANFAEWTGGSSMICDPWRGQVGAAGMLAVWYGKTAVDLVARLEQ
jgi:hypothetical protein